MCNGSKEWVWVRNSKLKALAYKKKVPEQEYIFLKINIEIKGGCGLWKIELVKNEGRGMIKM